MPTVLTRVVAWLREGYPTGVPQRDYIALLALLRRRLTDEEVTLVAHELDVAGLAPDDHVDIAAAIGRVIDEEPLASDIERVRDHLAFRGFPGDQSVS